MVKSLLKKTKNWITGKKVRWDEKIPDTPAPPPPPRVVLPSPYIRQLEPQIRAVAELRVKRAEEQLENAEWKIKTLTAASLNAASRTSALSTATTAAGAQQRSDDSVEKERRGWVNKRTAFENSVAQYRAARTLAYKIHENCNLKKPNAETNKELDQLLSAYSQLHNKAEHDLTCSICIANESDVMKPIG